MGPPRSRSSCSSKRLLETNLLHPRSRKRACLSHLRCTMRDIRRHQQGLEPGNFGSGYRGRLRSPCATPHSSTGGEGPATPAPCPLAACTRVCSCHRAARREKFKARAEFIVSIPFILCIVLHFIICCDILNGACHSILTTARGYSHLLCQAFRQP